MPDSPEIAEEIASLKSQIARANQRCDEAWANWDIDAYEGAISTGNRLYAKLRELIGKDEDA